MRMKSAYERAMEKFGGDDASPKLSDHQKKEIAEINTLYEAKIAERQTFLKSKIAQAIGSGNDADIQSLEEQLSRDVQALRDEWEAKKDKIWKKN